MVYQPDFFTPENPRQKEPFTSVLAESAEEKIGEEDEDERCQYCEGAGFCQRCERGKKLTAAWEQAKKRKNN